MLRGAVMTSAVELKKPPLAPKPKLVGTNNKSPPPPIAPKPDIGNASVPRLTKKTKPAIAPKPKVLTNSDVQDVKDQPSKKLTLNLEEREPELPESTGKFNCKDVGDAHGDYIFPTCSCSSGCTHEPRTRENLCAEQLVFEPLGMKENLENGKNGESSKRGSRWDSSREKCRSQSGVVLKASIFEEKLKEVLTQPRSRSPSSSPRKHRCPNKPEMNGDHSCARQVRIEFADTSSSQSSFGKAPHSCHTQPPRDRSQNLQTCQDGSAESLGPFHSCELEGKRGCSGGTSQKSEVQGLGPVEIHLLPYTSKFPTPKPRRTHAARLRRQKHVDTPSESTAEPESSNNGSSCLREDSLKNNKVSVLHQNALSNQGPVDEVRPGNKKALTGESNSDRQDSVSSQKAVQHETSSFEKVAPSLDTDSSLTSDSTVEDGSDVLPAVDRETAFIQCSPQPLSLPKQVKLACAEQQPTTCNREVSVPQIQKESSSRIVPKKPQRHSLPAAGVLKKAASEELVEKNSSSKETNSEKGLQRNHLQHLGPSNHGTSPSSFDMPNPTSEKPVWKLPHPILPFPGSPEALKRVTLSLNNEPSNSLTKPRAKSLSAVDMDRCSKPCKEPPKKTTFKKLINVKLSIGFIKSDFHKFRSKNCQHGDVSTGHSLGREPKGLENNWQGLATGEEKKSKPIKAYSAENCSLESQKVKSWSQSSAANGQRAESLDDQMLSGHASCQASSTSDCGPEYENVRHYEEIPEYENLPFVMARGNPPELGWQNSSSVEDTDVSLYEVEEPCDAPDGQLQLDPRHQPCSSGTCQDGQDELHLDLPSDEEVINSSDEDDVSSESSKGEPDPLEDKQVYFGN